MSSLAKVVPVDFLRRPEVGILVIEMVRVSPSLSVGADRLRLPAETFSEKVNVVSAPACGALLLGGATTGLEEEPPPPPPQAATMKAKRLARENLEKSLDRLISF